MSINPVALTQALIRCESVTPKEGGALNLLQGILTEAGFVCYRLQFEEKGSEPVENLFARFGADAPHFCFAGHSDVVPAGDAAEWKHPPFAGIMEGDRLYGRGAEDMKGAIAAFISAAIKFIRTPFNGSISLLITGDEEGVAVNGTRKALEWMQAEGHIPTSCLVGEPTNPTYLGEMIKIGRRGSINATLKVFGKQGHVAYPHLAENPVMTLIDILHALKSHRLDEGTEFFPPSNLEVTAIDVGNHAHNIIPGQAQAKLNIRFNDLHRGGELVQWVEKICKNSGAKYELKSCISGEAFLTPPGELSSVVAAAVEEVTGKKPALSTTGGTSDARFIKDYCPVIEFGTTGRTPHMVDEYIEVEDIYRLSKIYMALLRQYFMSFRA